MFLSISKIAECLVEFAYVCSNSLNVSSNLMVLMCSFCLVLQMSLNVSSNLASFQKALDVSPDFLVLSYQYYDGHIHISDVFGRFPVVISTFLETLNLGVFFSW